MKGIKTIVLFILAMLSIQAGWSQEVQFQATARSVVGVGETFALIYTVNAQGANFKGPQLGNFSLLSGPNMATSSSIQSINGRTSMTVTYSYTYYLNATREGTFEIGPATLTVDRKEYKSNSLTVKVVKNSSGAQGSTQGGSQQGGQQGVQSGANDVYLKAFVSKDNPLQGEGIVVTYKIFTKVPISQIAPKRISSFAGFWSHNLIKENDKLTQTTQVINGEKYVVADIRKIALYPLKSGRLVIEPFELECVAQIARQTRTRTGDPFFDDFFNDSFFNSSYAQVEKSLKSNPLVINVRALPDNGKPGDFSGAVGSFDFKTEVDKTKLKTNDAFTLKCTVSGTGNLQLIDKLNITFPPDFETYDPKVTSNITTTPSGMTGSQVFEYLVIPRKPGKFQIRPITFSYFDLPKNRYVTLTSPAYSFEVEKGTGEYSSVTYSGAGKEEIKYIGSDIRHIRNQESPLREAGKFFFGSAAFFLLLALPVVLFAVTVIVYRKQKARHSDVQLMKNRKATRVARNRLKKAAEYMAKNQEADFYIEISQALWGYISDKFAIPIADLSIDTVRTTLEARMIREELVDPFVRTLNDTEYARFAPGAKPMTMAEIYNKALDTITNMEKELR